MHANAQTRPATPTYAIDICRGARGGECPYTLAVPTAFIDALDESVRGSGWPAFLQERVRPVRHHNQFRIAVSGCANGCSRPHIADLGFIRAADPLPDPEACIHCGMCVEACPEHLVTLTEAGPAIDVGACLRCGRCAAACPNEALTSGPLGWRVVAGGRLGRRPRLADELNGFFDDAQAKEIARRSLQLYMDNWRPHLRFSDVVLEKGLQQLFPNQG